jgi:hypothetical protein
MPLKRFLYGQMFDVQQVQSGKALPSSFLMAGGHYWTAGGYWDMTQPGVYFIFNEANRQTARRAVTASEPLEMASVFSTVVRHHSRDNKLKFAQLDSEAKRRYLGLTCGAVSPWLHSWMVRAGFRARIVRFLTMEASNGYNDGHVALEMRRNVSGYPWTLVDADLARYYEDADGARLSVHEVVKRVPAWDFTIRPLAVQDRIDTAAAVDYDYATASVFSVGTEQSTRQWTERIFQAVGIDHTDGKTYWLLPPGSEHRKNWVLSLNAAWRVDATEAAWTARFY